MSQVLYIHGLIIPFLLFPSAEQKNIQQHRTVPCLKIGLFMGYIRRLGWAPWGHSQSSPNQTWPEHIRTHDSVCLNHMYDVWLMSTPFLSVKSKKMALIFIMKIISHCSYHNYCIIPRPVIPSISKVKNKPHFKLKQLCVYSWAWCWRQHLNLYDLSPLYLY